MAEEILDARDAALTGLFDDTSTLPPTRQPLDRALAAHVDVRSGDAGWLCDRRVIASAAADALADALPGGVALRLAVVVSRAGGTAFGAPLVQDLIRLAPLAATPGVELTAIEVPVVGKRPDEEVAAGVEALAAAAIPQATAVEVDVPIGDRPAGEVLRTLTAIGAAADGGRRMIARARVGAAGTVPPPGDVELAGFLKACADLRVPVTAGPGLAGPVRADDQDSAHGYLNLVAAAVMAHKGSALARIKGVLAAPAAQVRMGSGALIVGDEVIESDATAECRRDFLLGVGVPDVGAEIAALHRLEVLTAEGAKA